MGSVRKSNGRAVIERCEIGPSHRILFAAGGGKEIYTTHELRLSVGQPTRAGWSCKMLQWSSLLPNRSSYED